MLDKIVSNGRKLVTIIDPHTKVDNDYWIYSDTKSKDLAIKDLNSKDYVSECWPKDSVWFDYLKKET